MITSKHATELAKEGRDWFLFMIAVIVLACVDWGRADAGEASLTGSLYSRNANEDIYNVSEFQGFKIAYHFDKSPFYVFGSQDKAKVHPLTWGFDYTFQTLGGGMRHRVNEHVYLFGEIGYVRPENSWGARDGYNEGLEHYFNQRYTFKKYKSFKGFDIENEDTFSATFGVMLRQDFDCGVYLGFSAAYRILEFQELIKARLPDDHHFTKITRNNPNYYKEGSVDFSGPVMGLTVGYLF